MPFPGSRGAAAWMAAASLATRGSFRALSRTAPEVQSWSSRRTAWERHHPSASPRCCIARSSSDSMDGQDTSSSPSAKRAVVVSAAATSGGTSELPRAALKRTERGRSKGRRPRAVGKRDRRRIGRYIDSQTMYLFVDTRHVRTGGLAARVKGGPERSRCASSQAQIPAKITSKDSNFCFSGLRRSAFMQRQCSDPRCACMLQEASPLLTRKLRHDAVTLAPWRSSFCC